MDGSQLNQYYARNLDSCEHKAM